MPIDSPFFTKLGGVNTLGAWGYHILMILLGKSKKVTAVLKLGTKFSLKKEQLRIR